MSSKKIHILQQNNKLCAIIITLIYIIIVFIQLNDKILFLNLLFYTVDYKNITNLIAFPHIPTRLF